MALPGGTRIAGLPTPDQGHQTALEAAAAVKAKFPDAVLEHTSFRDEETLRLAPAALVDVCSFLKTHPDFRFTSLVDITASHWLERDYEYEVAWLLMSMTRNAVLRVKVRCGGNAGPGQVPTVIPVWPAADWMEREEWDKVGVVFTGHPNLVRILMPEDWEGHPLRKDYPMEGIGA